MKILQLNVWTGRIKGALLDFIQNNDFDVICMQEAVWSNREDVLENFCATVDQIKEASVLSYEARSSNWKMEFVDPAGVLEQGNVILSRYEIVDTVATNVHGKYQFAKTLEDFHEHAYTVQIVKLENGLSVVNHHGYWLPTPVGDEMTVSVMRKVASLVKEIDGPLVMCGDLNIIHAAPAMRELDFLRDLTEENGIDNTLSGLKFAGKVACDHILVNDTVKVQDFRVLDDLVSDHKALVVEIGA